MEYPTTITIAGKTDHPLTVNRMGYGTMRLTGEDIYGEPPNRLEALQILRHSAVVGVNFLDTADYYGEDVTNRLIAEALHPYLKGLVICTKVGATRKPDKSWVIFNRPENIRVSIEKNLRTLKLDQLSLVHFRIMPESKVPIEDSLGALFSMQKEGKILHVGVSNVSRLELEKALTLGEIATVENMYGHAERMTVKAPYGESRGGQEVLDLCELHGIPLIPYFSLFRSLPKKDHRIDVIAQKYQASHVQINLAWLLHRSAWILPIPGTSSFRHFEENMQATKIKLTPEDMQFLD